MSDTAQLSLKNLGRSGPRNFSSGERKFVGRRRLCWSSSGTTLANIGVKEGSHKAPYYGYFRTGGISSRIAFI